MGKVIVGSGMPYVNENELEEIRTIEDGFKRAYDQDAKGTIEAIDKLRNFAFQLINMNASVENEIDIKALMISIGDIARVAAETRMEPVCVASSRALGEITIEAAGQGREPLAVKALSIVGNLALEFAGKSMDLAAKGAAESLVKCGKASSKIKMETLASLSEIYLMQLVLKAMEKNLSETGNNSIRFLGEIGASSAEQRMEISTLEAAVILEDLGNASVREKKEYCAKATIEALENLGKIVSRYGLKNVLVQIAWSLEVMRVLTQEQGMKAAYLTAETALESLNTAGMLDEEQNLEKIQEIRKFHSLFLKNS